MKKLLFFVVLFSIFIPIKTESLTKKTDKQIIRDIGFGKRTRPYIMLKDSVRFTIYPNKSVYDRWNGK